MHKYLEELGIKATDICIPNSENTEDSRMPRFLDQREKYGFDERETWSLDYTFACWLYEHLKMYLDVNCVDLEFYKFDIPVVYEIPDCELVYDVSTHEETGYSKYPQRYTKTITETHTQGDCINLCVEYLKKYLTEDPDEEDLAKGEMIRHEYCDTAVEIFRIILPAMWW